jgi:hypothetical protein
MALKQTVNEMNKLLAQITQDLQKAEGGNKAASQRVRTGTISLEKVAKKYRKESIAEEKKTKGAGRKPAAKAAAKKPAAKPAAKAAAKKPAAKAPAKKVSAKPAAAKKAVVRTKAAGKARVATASRG